MSCHVASGCCPEGPWGPRSLGTNHTLAVPCSQVKGNFSQSQGKKEQRGQASPGHPATLGPWPILPLLSSPWTPKGPGQDRAGRNGASPGQAVSSPKGGSWARKTEEGGVVPPLQLRRIGVHSRNFSGHHGVGGFRGTHLPGATLCCSPQSHPGFRQHVSCESQACSWPAVPRGALGTGS